MSDSHTHICQHCGGRNMADETCCEPCAVCGEWIERYEPTYNTQDGRVCEDCVQSDEEE